MYLRNLLSMKLFWQLLKHYFTSDRKEWLRFDTFFLVIGLVLSVATLMTTTLLFDGYENALKNTILGVNSHVYFFKAGSGNLTTYDIRTIKEYLNKQPAVKTSEAIITTQAIIQHKGQIKGCFIKSVNWRSTALPIRYREFVKQGTWKLTADNDIVIGYHLLKALQAQIGDTLWIFNPSRNLSNSMQMMDSQIPFRICGIYRSGMYEYDSKFIYANEIAMRQLAEIPDEFSMFEVELKPTEVERAKDLSLEWDNHFKGMYQVSSWIDWNGNIFSLITMEKWLLFLIISFLVLIASFNIINNIRTTIMEKKREIGILKAYGMNNTSIRWIYVTKTLLLSMGSIVVGELLGILLGWGISKQTIFFLKGDVYLLEKLYIHVQGTTCVAVFFLALCITIIACLLPLRRISSLQITNILRD